MLFKYQYAFLSNFYRVVIVYEGQAFPTLENAYQAAKLPKDQRLLFRYCMPAEAKRLERNSVNKKPDWVENRLPIMEELLRYKFAIPNLWQQLLAIKGEIIEENYHHDTFWGVCNGVGENQLGKLLMKIRDELQK